MSIEDYIPTFCITIIVILALFLTNSKIFETKTANPAKVILDIDGDGITETIQADNVNYTKDYVKITLSDGTIIQVDKKNVIVVKEK